MNGRPTLQRTILRALPFAILAAACLTWVAVPGNAEQGDHFLDICDNPDFVPSIFGNPAANNNGAIDDGIESDCRALLQSEGQLAGTRIFNWGNDNKTMADWDGVGLGNSNGVTRVTELRFSNRGLTGSIPEELGMLSALVRLELEKNQLTGTIPTELGNLSALVRLQLDKNQLTGTIPTELGNLSALVRLQLYNNQLTGSIPENLGSLSALEMLRLENNRLTGRIPSEFGGLTNLEYLHLNNNQLIGSIPWELGNLGNLVWLILGKNNLTGRIPSELGQLQERLSQLNLSDNRLTGDIPGSLGDLTNLSVLDLGSNNLTGRIPSNLRDLANLRTLDLSESNLTGSIPLALGNLENLTKLYLNDNRLTGTIPPELGNLMNLTDLQLRANHLTGGIPWELGELTRLKNLDLGDNNLTGAIPSELGNIDFSDKRFKLRTLYLDHNRLTGTITAELGKLKAIEQLYLSSNNLTGDVPAWPANFADLKYMRLGDNRFSGCISAELRSLQLVEEVEESLSDSEERRILLLGNPTVDELSADVGLHWCDAAPITRIAASPRTLAIPSGEEVRIGLRVYGLGGLADPALIDETVSLSWTFTGGGTAIRDADGAATPESLNVILTAPDSPGSYTLTASLDESECRDDLSTDIDECSANIEVQVLRGRVSEPSVAPVDPDGVIPVVIADDSGEQHSVFTPAGGGFFEGEDVTVIAPPGAVPNGELIGVRAQAAEDAANIGQTHHRVTLAGSYYLVSAVDAAGRPISNYRLAEPIEICIPLPPELASRITDTAIASTSGENGVTLLSGRVRLTTGRGLTLCGRISELPVKVAAAKTGSPTALPTTGPERDPLALPDTGGTAPSNAILPILLILLLGAATTVMGFLTARQKHHLTPVRRPLQNSASPQSRGEFGE